MTIARKELTRYSGVSESRITDSSFNDQRVIFGGYDKLFVYAGGVKSFEKDVNAKGREPSASITPGAYYIIYTHNEKGKHNADFKIINAENADLTPVYDKNANEDVIFVHANDKGLFFLTSHGTTLKYYQVGAYTTEYNSETVTPTDVPVWVNDISKYSNGQYSPIIYQTFASLDPRVIYHADKNIKLNIIKPYTSNSLGILSINKDSLFAVDMNHNPILIKGQMTANFGSPVTIYAIKFNQYSSRLFEEKLDKFMHHELPENEYFIIQNTHTIFTLSSSEGKFNVATEDGEVSIIGENIEETVVSGKQITIDKDNKIEKSVYIPQKVFGVILSILILILSSLLFVYRKTKVGKILIRFIKDDNNNFG